MWHKLARTCLPLALLSVAAMHAGCVSADGMGDKLRDTSSAYNRSLRWGDFDRAAKYLPVDSQQAFLATYEGLEDNLIIVDYEMTRLDLDKETGIAASRAEIVWHRDDSTIIKTTVVDQAWQFHEGQFVLVDERRAGGVPLGAFAELEEDPHPYLPGLEAYRKAHEIGKENQKKRKRRRRGKADPAESQTAKR
jgi:hypothetical protein